MADPTTFDWTEYDRLNRELDSLCSAWNGWKTSYTNMMYTGYDDHGVLPGENDIYERRMVEVNHRIDALGEPPACTTCRGRDYHRTSGPDSCGDYWHDEHPSTCPTCGRRPEWDPYTGERIDWDDHDDRVEIFAQRYVCLPVYDYDVPF